jgi:hypothetical protein
VSDVPRLGRCCLCETYDGVANVLMLDYRAPKPGTGWGCVVCALPSDGAVAVVCDKYLELVEAGASPIFVCVDYASKDQRIAVADFTKVAFGHHAALHAEEQRV